MASDNSDRRSFQCNLRIIITIEFVMLMQTSIYAAVYCVSIVPVAQSGILVPLGQKLQPCNSVQTAPGGHTVMAQSGKVLSI